MSWTDIGIIALVVWGACAAVLAVAAVAVDSLAVDDPSDECPPLRRRMEYQSGEMPLGEQELPPTRHLPGECRGGTEAPSTAAGWIGRHLDKSAIFLCIMLGLGGCQSATDGPEPAEPRMMTRGSIQPICLAFCQIHENLTASEGIHAPNAQSVSGQLTGGTSTSQQSRGVQ